ncbi:MAG: hypothetical protein KIG16_01095 [Eubacteriales bacterium]|nr:hypothetical protein [Eubacteriales bacterium]
MKIFKTKIATIIAALAVVVVLGTMLAACGKSSGYKELTYDEYKENLTYYSYGVFVFTPQSDNWESEFGSMKKSFNTADYYDAYNAVDDLQWVLLGGKNVVDNYNYIRIYGFADNSKAKVIYNALQSKINTLIDDAKTAEQVNEYKQMKVVLAGNVVMYASTQNEIDAAYRAI